MDLKFWFNTFRTIPLNEIEEFLRQDDLHLPQSSEDSYLLVWDYLLNYPDLEISSVLIKDFLLAYKSQGIPLTRYTSSFILSSPDEKLEELAHSLGLPKIERDRIIRILGYSNLLDNDLSVLDLLPKETLKFIGMQLDSRSLSKLGLISRRFHQMFEVTGELTEMLRIKLTETILFDLSHFTKKQLGFLSQRNSQSSLLSTGTSHSLVVNSRGQAFGFGNKTLGRLGIGSSMQSGKTPVLIKFPRIEKIDPLGSARVISVSAGSSHSLFLSSQGRAYSCGDNIFGQLGLNSNDNQSAPIWIESLRTEEIIDVSAGTIHSLFLTSQGQVYGCGSNKRGQLGTENQIEKKIPTLIESIKSVKVIAISAGRCHSLILDHRGQVFGFGDNENGQLGLGDQANRYLPVLVLRVNKIVAISAGGFHSLVLNDQGQIYSFGSNSSGQLGRRDIDYGSVTPLLIKDSGFGKAVAISAGSHHSLLLNSLGQVFSFGSNVYGQLGLGGDDDIPFPTLIELSIGKISAISAGDSHSLIMNSEGQVLSFGSNEYDQLGLGDEDGTSIPTLIRGFRF